MKIQLLTITFCAIYLHGFGQDLDSHPVHHGLDIEESKMSYYKALVIKNNFNITLGKGNEEAHSKTKADFYKLLLQKNGFETHISPSEPTEVDYVYRSDSMIATF